MYAGHGAPVLSQVVTPKGDPADAPGTFSGIVEVNHPGGACWDTTTPDIRPGDLVQLEVVGGGGPNMGRTDETIVANVTNKRAVQTGPGTIQVHGSARDAFGVAPGNPLDVTTVEQRLVAPGSRLELNGRRTLRATSLAGADGTLSYDPGSPNWTATYSGLSAADVTLALGAESRSLWLGNVAPRRSRAPSTRTVRSPSPVPARRARRRSSAVDLIAPSAPTDVIGVASPENLGNDGSVTLTFNPSTDNVGVHHYIVHRNDSTHGSPRDFLVSTAGPYEILDGGLKSDVYEYGVEAFDGAAPANTASSTLIHVTVAAAPDLTPPTTPGNVVATASPDIHGRGVSISWAASTDNAAVNGYRSCRNGIRPTTVLATTRSYLDSNLPAGTYGYALEAIDTSGNASGQSPASTAVVANDPPVAPHSVIAFPSRDFISATGFTPGSSYTFALFRGNGSTFVSGQATAQADGTVEVNHPGGTCWNVNTPNIKPGDVIRITDDVTGVADQTTVANVTAGRPIAANATTVVIHGTAQDANGQPLPIGQIEQRLIANRDAFELNGRRTLRAGAAADGVLTYDAPGSVTWTATYSALSAKDVVRAVGGTAADGAVFIGAESRAHRLGRDPVGLTEATIFENGTGVVGGPSAPCAAPAEPDQSAASLSPASIVFPATPYPPVSTSAVRTVTISSGGSVPLRVSNVYVAGMNPGEFVRTGGTCPVAPFAFPVAGSSICTVDLVFRPSVAGLRQAYLAVSDDAANTTDQAVALTGIGVDNSDPLISVVATPSPNNTCNVVVRFLGLPTAGSYVANVSVAAANTFGRQTVPLLAGVK